jgi:hypothetical protein
MSPKRKGTRLSFAKLGMGPASKPIKRSLKHRTFSKDTAHRQNVRCRIAKDGKRCVLIAGHRGFHQHGMMDWR